MRIDIEEINPSIHIFFSQRVAQLCLILCATLFLIIYCIISSAVPAHSIPICAPKTILIIHSFSPTDTWTVNTNKAIIDTFKRQSPATRLRFEFMDSKNFSDPSYLSSLALMYANKYAFTLPDGIIATDNDALRFMQTYGVDIFPNVPVVASGINNAQLPSADSNIRSIIAEKADHLGTIRQAIRMRPYI
jgi:hypothetical protein